MFRFTAPMAVDEVQVPVGAELLWGTQRHGRTVIVRGRHRAAMGLAGSASAVITVALHDPDTPWIEVTPLLSASGAATASAPWLFRGTSAARRSLETGLTELTRQVLTRQRRNRCFSCHHALPLALSVTEASRRGFVVPRALLDQLATHTLTLQRSDGGFFFPDHAFYGKILTSIVGTFALRAIGNLADPTVRNAIGRGVRFLLPHQEETGAWRPDFMYPPLLIGRSAPTWLMVQLLGSLRRQGLPIDEPALRAALAGAQAWFNDASGSRFEPDLFAGLCLPYAGTFPEEDRATRLQNLRIGRSQLTPARDRALCSLFDRLLIDLSPNVPPAHASDPGGFSTIATEPLSQAIWRLYGAISRQQPAEQSVEECRW